MRWLSIHFDFQLSFAHNASKMAAKSCQIAEEFTMLENTTRGCIIRKEISTFILLIHTYKTPAWWPSCLRKDKKRRNIKNGIERYCRKWDKSQNLALCGMFPVWKTIPVKIIQKKAATSAIYYTLDHLCKQAGLRIQKLETKHHLGRKTKYVYLSS